MDRAMQSERGKGVAGEERRSGPGADWLGRDETGQKSTSERTLVQHSGVCNVGLSYKQIVGR